MDWVTNTPLSPPQRPKKLCDLPKMMLWDRKHSLKRICIKAVVGEKQNHFRFASH